MLKPVLEVNLKEHTDEIPANSKTRRGTLSSCVKLLK